jgi:hypothetical protein
LIKKRLQHRRDYKYKKVKGKEDKGKEKEKENNECKIFDIQTYNLFI